MDEHIPNRELYNSRMARTVVDKIFFLAHIDADVFIDFGCGNGEVLRAISNFHSDSICIGYDISKEMLEEAREMSPKEFHFTDSLEAVRDFIELYHLSNLKVCLILSSVIHEIYAYSSPEVVSEFWNFANNAGFDYIAIRDMSYSHNDLKIPQLAIKEIYKTETYKDELSDFVDRWGSLYDGINTLHFLLKYRYRDNWSRELNEDYLPISYSVYFKNLSNYDCIYEHRYVLPYIKKIVYEDFGIELQTPTHCQIIFERRKN